METKNGAGSNHKRRRGQSMAEYALIIALVAIAVIGAVSFLGDSIKGVFTRTGEVLENVEIDDSL